jgi:hypothetical protein
MTRWTTLLAAGLLAACGKDEADPKKKSPEPPRDRPAEPVAKAPDAAAPPAAPDAARELPPPETFVGKARLVNLLVDRAGKAQTVDVWARRSFTHGPLLLASGIDVGEASDWFAAPKGQSIVIVATGAGPDAAELGGMFSPSSDEEQMSHTLTLRDTGTPSAGLTQFEAVPPPAGKGLVVLEAGAFGGHAEAFKPLLGSWGYAFKVGDGAACRAGRQPQMMLGGTSYVDYELDPGKATFALHRGDDYQCAQPPVYTFEVDVVADAATMVHVYTPDAKRIAHLALPLAL